MQISVIIPAYNEASNLPKCLEPLCKKGMEIIIADSPNSNDRTKEIADSQGIVYLKTTKAGRNHQMNEAASISKGEILYFVHADTLVSNDFDVDIIKAIEEGADLGCYRYKFDHYPTVLLYINSFFTRFPMLWCRGGDQTLFIKRSVFEKLGGFSETHSIMEDYDLIKRAKAAFKFKIIPKDVLVSSRKYIKNSYFEVQMANYKVMKKYLSGNYDPENLKKMYQNLLK